MTDLDKLRYPVGPIDRPPTPLDPAARAAYLQTIEQLPARIRALVSGLNDQQLDTPYRPGGWTIRQVVHHVPDSHLNAYIRMKLAVTEDEPAIKTYEEAPHCHVNRFARCAASSLDGISAGASGARVPKKLRAS